MDAKCDICPLRSVFHTFVPSFTSPDTEILFVGQAPGETEQRKKKPFCGPAGRILWEALRLAGLCTECERYEAYLWAYGKFLKPLPNIGLDNVVHCYPPKDREPSPTEIECCFPILEALIASLPKLKVIVGLGDIPLFAFTGRRGITKERGMPRRLDNGLIFLPTVHPSFVLRQRQWFDAFARDIQKAKRYLEQGWEPEECVWRDIDQTAIEELMKTGFAFDIETTGLNPYNSTILGVAFSNGETTVHASGNSPSEWEMAKSLLESKAKKIAQNNGFDVPFLYAHGVRITRVDGDSRYLEHLLDPSLPANLSFIAAKYLDLSYYKDTRAKLITGKLSMLETKEYCCKDAWTTWKAYEKQKREIQEEPNLLRVYEEIVMPCSEVANSLQIKGVRFDLERGETLKQEILEKISPIKDLFAEYGWNINSNVQLLNLLNEAGFLVRNTQKETLKRFAERTGHPIFETILEYRKYSKFLSTFIEGIETRLDPQGYIHTHYNVIGTENSRWSSSNPNLQNIPKEGRVLFIPDGLGYGFMQGDFKQLELFVAALLSGDKKLLNDLKEKSVHDAVSERVYGKDYTSKQRRQVKAMIFGTLYGRSPRSVAIDFGISVKEAKMLQNAIFDQYPKLKTMINKNVALLQKNGYMESIFGRRRYFEGGGNIRADAVNYPIQTAAGDINNLALIKAYQMELDIRLTTHDDIVIQYPLGQEDEYADKLQTAMSQPIKEFGGFRFPVKIEFGRNWGEMEEYVSPRSDIKVNG